MSEVQQRKPSPKWKYIRNSAVSFVKHGHLHYFPIAKTFRHYSLRKFGGDVNAGLNTALLAFPQGIAYALIAGLPIAYGIYASILAALSGAFFSRSPFAALGPTNSTCVLLMSTFAILEMDSAERASTLPLLLLMVAIILIASAYLKLGNIIQYVSRSVITGYLTASAALIIANQSWQVLGIHIDKPSITFYQIVYQTVLHLHNIHWPTVLLASITFAIYFILDRQFKTFPNIGLTLILSSLVGWGLSALGWGLSYVDPIDIHHWAPTIPSLDFGDLSHLASSALAISLLCLLESASIGKLLAARAGQKFNINQEMFAMGMANLSCSFFSGMPASTSQTRSLLSWKSGAGSSLNNILSALFCLGIASLLGPFTANIPTVTLSVLIIVVGFSMVNRHSIHIVMRSTPSDAIVFITTLVAGLLFPLDSAVYFGVAISVALFLRMASTPQMVEYTFNEAGQLTEIDEKHPRVDLGISIVNVEGNLFFAAADLFLEQIRRVCEDSHLKVVILKMRNAYHLDASSVMALEELVRYMKENNRILLVSEARRDSIKIFKRSGLMDVIGRDHIFADSQLNPTISTARALRKAQEIIGPNATRITIYTEPSEMEGATNNPFAMIRIEKKAPPPTHAP